MKFIGYQLLCLATAVSLSACGGSDERSHTFVLSYGGFGDTSESLQGFRRLLFEAGIDNAEFRCGSYDQAHVPLERQALWVGAQTPLFLLVTGRGEDIDKLRDANYPGLYPYEFDIANFTSSHSPARACDPFAAA